MSRGNRSRPAHERTAEERERDREERERRRAGRPPLDEAQATAPSEPPLAAPLEQRHTDEAPAVEPADPVEPTDAVAHEASVAEEDPVAYADASDPPDLTTAAEHGVPATHSVAASPSTPASPSVPVEPAFAAETSLARSVEGEQGEGEPLESPAAPVAEDDASESTAPPIPPPARMRREEPLARRPGSASIGGPAQSASSRAGGGRRSLRGPGEKGRRKLTRARGGALLALALAVAAAWFLLSLFQPFAGAGSGRVIVEIPKGSSSSKIGSILARDGVVSSGFFFELRALLGGKRGDLHSGRYQLKRNMSYTAAIDALSKPPPAAIMVTVVIPEGYTRSQIAALTREDALAGSYLSASKRSSRLKATRYGAPRGTSSLEGFLFPATYEMTAGVPVSRLVAEQLLAFRQRFGVAEIRRARALHVTPYQLLTVASMIEREAQTAHDRPLIAAVIYNRLRQGIALGIDATIYYAVELEKGIPTYTHELSVAQLQIDSPYNTRTHKGLPPTPISNPGLASIKAAAHPAHVGYLYYVAAADGCGEQAFSATYAEFQTNVAAYQAAVKKNGGHPPTCKRK